MTAEKLKYIADATLAELEDKVEENLERYVNGNFQDLTRANGWSIELQLEVDLEPITKLDSQVSPEAEIKNSITVWKALSKLSPTLASENRIWTRLTHLEGLEFSRQRWLSGKAAEDKTSLAIAIKTHFFADTHTKRRDDNAISRLWWNAYIAKLILPDQQEVALKALLKTADIRSNLIERPRTVSRPLLAAGIVRAMNRDPWITQIENNFRTFMKTLNKFGGGELFEVMTGDEIDVLISQVIDRSKLASA
jgi:hypothetical protein